MPDPTAPAGAYDLRDRIVEKLRQFFDDPPLDDGAGAFLGALADAVLAVRDEELERLRAELARMREQRDTALHSSSGLGEANRVWQDAHAETLQRAEQAEGTIERIRRAVTDTYGEDYAGGDTAAEVERLMQHLRAYEAEVQRIISAKNEGFAKAEAERDRYRLAWQSARERAKAYGDSMTRCASEIGRLEAERDALKAVIEQVRVHAPRLVYETDADGRRTGTPLAICCEGCTDPDLLADLDRGELTEDVPEWPCPPVLAALDTPDTAPETPACPRCEGNRFEPGTEEEGDWDSTATRHHPPTGEPCTACGGTGKAIETPEASDG